MNALENRFSSLFRKLNVAKTIDLIGTFVGDSSPPDYRKTLHPENDHESIARYSIPPLGHHLLPNVIPVSIKQPQRS